MATTTRAQKRPAEVGLDQNTASMPNREGMNAKQVQKCDARGPDDDHLCEPPGSAQDAKQIQRQDRNHDGNGDDHRLQHDAAS